MGVLLTVATIVLATGAGVAAESRWRGRAAELARAGLTASVFTLLPFVTFFNVARLEIDADIGFGILLGYVAIAIAAVLAWWAGRAMDLSRPTRGALITCALVANTGYLGYPLTASLLGFDALGEAVIWDLLVGAPALLLLGFAVGAAYGEKAGETPRERVRAFFTRNPPLYAAIAALLAPDALAPDALVDASRVAVIALLPIGFFAVGAILAEEAEEGTLRARIAIPPSRLDRDRAADDRRAGTAARDGRAAHRPPGPLPPARRHARRHQHAADRPRLRPGPPPRRPSGRMVNRDRDRRRARLAGVLRTRVKGLTS